MGVPEWFLEVDSRKTKMLHDNACIQIVIHFRGPIASRLEQVSDKHCDIFKEQLFKSNFLGFFENVNIWTLRLTLALYTWLCQP